MPPANINRQARVCQKRLVQSMNETSHKIGVRKVDIWVIPVNYVPSEDHIYVKRKADLGRKVSKVDNEDDADEFREEEMFLEALADQREEDRMLDR